MASRRVPVVVVSDLTQQPPQPIEVERSISPEDSRGPTKRGRSSPTDSGDEGGPGHSGPPSRRGARASYYRKPQDDGESASHRLAAVPEEQPQSQPQQTQQPQPPRKLLHDRLLDASDEGDLDGLRVCLQDPAIDTCLNLAGWSRNVTPKGHPETLSWGRGETALRYAAFHSHKAVVSALLEAGAVPALRNDDAKHAQALCEEGSRLLAKMKRSHVEPEDLPRNAEQDERDEVWWMLGKAMEQQWIVRGAHVAGLDGRIAQIVNVGRDGRRLAIIADPEPSARRTYYEAQAVRSAYLTPSQLVPAPPPPAGMKQWPLDARFGCALAGKKHCECAATAVGAPRCENVAPHTQADAGPCTGAVMGPPAPVPLRAVANRNATDNVGKH
jgi:hypothetical protein